MAKKKKPIDATEVAETQEPETTEPSIFEANLFEEADTIDDENVAVAAPDEFFETTDEPQQDAQKASAAPLVIGGIVAAVIGFGAARSNFLDQMLPPAWRMNAGEVALQEKIDETQSLVASLEKKISETARVNASVSVVDLGEFEAELTDQISGIESRIDTLEGRPVVSGSGTPDFNDDFDKLREVAEKQQAEIDTLLADARLAEETSLEAASKTLARAAASRIVAAIESGAPFASALSDLEATGVSGIPAELQAVAGVGVVTLVTLQDEMPDAARAALAASPVDENSGFGGFLKRQLGVRSVAPREGTDPDAVLSRIEGAVRQGRLTDALAEAETLPEDSKSAISDWLENAKTRLAVTSASETLMQRLSAN